MGGLIPAWTPGAKVLPVGHPFQGFLGAVSQPWYFQMKYNTTTKEIDVLPNKIHSVNELVGNRDYEQPR
jgi:hypothetical protein